MKNMKNALAKLLSVFNYPYISEELLKEIKGPILLHISDTPVDIYNYIFRIIDILKPEFIIHTGDLADNIKLGLHKDKINYYKSSVKKLINGLEKNGSSEIYYIMGNHDDYKIVSQLTKKGKVLEEGLLTVVGCRVAAGHYYKEILHTDFNLYGHSIEPLHFEKEGIMYLNGLSSINIIDLSTKRVFHLEYPLGTNGSRGMELKRIGL